MPRQLIQAAPASMTANVAKATLVIPLQVVVCNVPRASSKPSLGHKHAQRVVIMPSQTAPLAHACVVQDSRTALLASAASVLRAHSRLSLQTPPALAAALTLFHCHQTHLTAVAKKGFGARCPRRATCNVKHAVWERTRVLSTTAFLAQIVLQMPRQLIQAAPASRTANVTKATLVIPPQVVVCNVPRASSKPSLGHKHAQLVVIMPS